MSDLSRKLAEIHERLAGGSPTASLELFERALNPLRGYLRRKFPRLPAEDAYDQAVDAIIGFIDDPGAFDAEKSSLWSFLCMVAQRNVQDAWRAKMEHAELEEKNGLDLELWGVQSNNDHDNAEISHDAETIMRDYGEKFASTDVEREVLRLLLEGERDIGPFATAIGLDPDDTAAGTEVKRVKDRIKFRMKQVSDDFK
jgi:RNA polymerase sigma-70 factor (ECF subfamily)